jgi:hypothetical protein
MPNDQMESAADELYGLPPSEFIPARTRLAKELKAGGDRDGAAVVQSMRKPTVSAWAVNRLSRERPKEMEELLAMGERLRQAQRKALAGGGAKELQETAGARRALVDRLTEAAGEILEGAGLSGGRTHLDDVANTLLATATDPGAAEAVRLGRLEKELPAPAGFGEVGDLATVIPMPKRPPPGRAPKRGAEPAAVESAAEARARKRAEELGRQADEAEREAQKAREEASGAETDARRLQEAAERARRDAARTARDADRAEQRAATARKRATQAAARVTPR